MGACGNFSPGLVLPGNIFGDDNEMFNGCPDGLVLVDVSTN